MTSEISKVSVNGLAKISTYKQSQFRKEKWGSGSGEGASHLMLCLLSPRA